MYTQLQQRDCDRQPVALTTMARMTARLMQACGARQSEIAAFPASHELAICAGGGISF